MVDLETDTELSASFVSITSCHGDVVGSQAAAAAVAATLRNKRDHAEEDLISPVHFQAFDDNQQELLEQDRVCALAVSREKMFLVVGCGSTIMQFFGRRLGPLASW